jgi:RES domain-containing protein
MLIYRITLTKFAGKLIASGRAARWNPNDVEMIYTASSRSLACLENVVHRSQAGLNGLFSIMAIECPDQLKIQTIHLKDLPEDWQDFNQMRITQKIGVNWISENETAILQVPSSIIDEEVNYLLNPAHKDFNQIRVISNQPFVFDKRIKQ